MISNGVKNLFQEQLSSWNQPIVNHTMWSMYHKPPYKVSFLRGYCLLVGEMCPRLLPERSTGTE